MKKKIWIAVCIILSALLISLYIIKTSNTPPISYDKNVILENENAYTSIAELVYEDYSRYNTKEIYAYDINYNKKYAICYTNDKKINLSDEQLKNYEIIESTYRLDKHSFSRIYVYDSFVTFGIENGRASFVYSVNNEPPIYINRPDDDDTDIYVEKITGHWYYTCVIRHLFK